MREGKRKGLDRMNALCVSSTVIDVLQVPPLTVTCGLHTAKVNFCLSVSISPSLSVAVLP